MNELPQGWIDATLDDIALVNPGRIAGLSADTSVSFVPMPAVSDVDGEIVSPTVRPFAEVSTGYTQFQEGDVIFAKITPCMENGKIAVARSLESGVACGSTEFHVVRPLGENSPDYIWRFLRQKSFRDDAEASMTGAVGQRRVPAVYLKESRVPLPPLPEQRRIVAKIDSLTGKSRRARDHLDHIPRLVEKYKQAVLAAAFRGDLTREWRREQSRQSAVLSRDATRIRQKYAEAGDFLPPYDVPASWRWLRLPQLGDLDRGKSRHRPRNDKRLFGGAYPFIQTGEVRQADRFLTTYHETYSDFGLAQSRLWPVGTVCITIAANIAETAILRIDACFPDSVVGFLPDADKADASYIEFFLRTARGELEAFAPATAQKNINLDTLATVRVPIAPLVEQVEIVRRTETAFAWIDRLASEAASARHLIDRLDQSVLAKAFRGELVPQDPADEPASVLLERIRAERAAGASTIQRRKLRKAGQA